jgi:hypothetical protein
VDRFASEGDRNFNPSEVLHAFRFGRCDGPILTPNFIVIGERPKLHTVGFGAGSQRFWRERAIRDHGVAMKIGVE